MTIKSLESKNIEFTADELLNYIHSAEFNNGDNLDDVKLNIKLYKLLENINEKNINLKSILLNTINVILEKNYDKIIKDLSGKASEVMSGANDTMKIIQNNPFIKG